MNTTTDMADLKLLVENYLKSSYRTTPVRSPFSQTNYYSGGKVSGGSGSWKEYTDLYNTSYRTHFQEDGFDRVVYNEPLNMMVMWPKDDAEAFQHIDEDCIAQLGLKTARGFKKDYRFLDQSIPGAGKIALSEEEAERLVEEPFKALREVRPQYSTNLGEVPVERIDESAQPQEEEEEEENAKLAIRRKVHELLQQELEEELAERRDRTLVVNESENDLARKAARYLQINEDLTRFEDAVLDVCARRLRESSDLKLSKKETEMLNRAVSKVPVDNTISKNLNAKTKTIL